jgi:hypothetical protein
MCTGKYYLRFVLESQDPAKNDQIIKRQQYAQRAF